MKEMDDTMKKLLVDYRIHVVCLEDLKEENFKTGLRELIGLMKRREDKAAMKKYCDENAERFKYMDEDSYEVICKMLNLKDLSGKKEAYKNHESEDYDMCRAFDEMIKDGEKRGEKRLGSLMEKLLQSGRLEEALEASSNENLRQKLYQEYSIS